jgi:TolB-like protein
MPFNNYSGQEDAGKQVSNAFLVELLKKPFFKVVDPGEVDRVMREERIRSSDQIDYETARKLKDQLSTDYILIGSVNEYGLIKSGEREIPIVGFSIRMLDTESGQIVWAASHSRKGDDGESIFGWGTIRSLTKLSEKTVRQVVVGMKAQH